MTPLVARKPAFWIALLVASALCVFAVLHWFGEAFSVLDLDVTMSRTAAVDEARRIVSTQALLPNPPAEAVARFDGDNGVQTFIELEGGGKPALKPFVGRGASDAGGAFDAYSLYRWRVRLFTPGVDREATVEFAPDGRPTGFFVRVPEAAPGAALSEAEARAIAVAAAAKDWHVDFARYRALTASSIVQPGKRVDHQFVYERTADGAPAIGDGRLRLALGVAGDRLTQVRRFVYVPEAFARRYATLRSVNNNIAAAASVAAGLLYGLGGCLIGTIWLMRRHAIRWRPSAVWAGVVASLIAAAALAAIPGSWFGYDTAKSATLHAWTQAGVAIVGGVVTWLMLTVVFATAEGLGRLAFGAHPQQWRAWRLPAASAREIWGRTLAGYAWIGFDLAFIALFYFVVDRMLGWWSPSDALIDPNILGKPLPWLSPVSMALQAGMMEESLFRAVPLAGAALLGRRFGRERLFVGIALVLQAVVFGCAHANYPGQPAYARPVELFVPALVWGIVYLRYGLLPGMLFHFGFDLVLMSLPLFVTDVPGIGIDRAIVVAILAVPLAVLAVQRWRAGRLIDLPASERNAAGGSSGPDAQAVENAALDVVDRVERAAGLPVPPPTSIETPVAPALPAERDAGPDGTVVTTADAAAGIAAPRAPARWEPTLLAVLAIVGLVGLGLRIAQPYDAPGLSIGRTEALAIAERTLADRGVKLDDRWRRSVRAVGGGDPYATRFVWREGGRPLFAKLVGGAIAPPHWEVRFARFEGDVAARDAWRVTLVDGRPMPDGVRVVEHEVPEARPGPRLGEDAARTLADAAIAASLRLDPVALRRVSAQAAERPARVDWSFVYADPAIAMPAGGEVRVVAQVAGDEVVTVARTIFVPEAWRRDDARRDERLLIPRSLLALGGLAFGIAVLVSLVRRLVRGEASRIGAAVAALLLVVVLIIGFAAGYDATTFGFTVAEPFENQRLRLALGWAAALAGGAVFAALVGAVGVRLASRAEPAAPRSPVARWLAPVALALFVAGLGGFGTLAGAAHEPHLPAVGAADEAWPWLASAIGELAFPSAAAAIVLVAALCATRTRVATGVVGAAFVLGPMLGRAASPDVSVGAVVVAGVGGAIGWWLFRTLVRDRLWVVAPLVLAAALVNRFVALCEPAWPGARIAAVVGAAMALVGYAAWRWTIARDAARHSPASTGASLASTAEA